MKNLISILVFMTAFHAVVFSQAKEIKKGDKAYKKGDYVTALDYYSQAEKKNAKMTVQLQQNIANCKYYLMKFGESKENFDQIAKDDLEIESSINYGRLCQRTGEYEKAGEFFDQAIQKGAKDPLVSLNKKACEWALANKTTSGYDVQTFDLDVLGISFGLTFYKNGIVYSGISKKGGRDKFDRPYTDLYYSVYQNGTLGLSELLSEKLIFEDHEGAPAFTQDEKTILFTRIGSNKKGVYQKIYESVLGPKGWESPKELPFNGKKYSCAYPWITPEGNTMYFSSDMPGGQGGMDLYMVVKNGNKWGKPVNLGENINTPGDEVYPFINALGDLYFSSNGHEGYGGLDIFFSTGSGTDWTQPTNMRMPVNSEKDDFGYAIDPNTAEISFLTSNRNSETGELKIYKLKAIAITDVAVANTTDNKNTETKTGTSESLDNFLDASNEPEEKVDSIQDKIKTENSNPDESMSLEEHLKVMMGENAVIYRVQFKSTKKPVDKLTKIETGDYVYRYFFQGLYRYTVGEFYDPDPAIELKDKLIKMGYKDAFVAAFKGTERILDVQIYNRPKDNK
jgi:hypothetical protein